MIRFVLQLTETDESSYSWHLQLVRPLVVELCNVEINSHYAACRIKAQKGQRSAQEETIPQSEITWCDSVTYNTCWSPPHQEKTWNKKATNQEQRAVLECSQLNQLTVITTRGRRRHRAVLMYRSEEHLKFEHFLKPIKQFKRPNSIKNKNNGLDLRPVG